MIRQRQLFYTNGMKNVMNDIFVKSGVHRTLTRIDRHALVYLHSDGNYVHLHMMDAPHMVYATLRGMQERLANPKLVQVHKSYVVNLDQVASVAGNRIALRNGMEVPIGRSFRRAFLARLKEMRV